MQKSETELEGEFSIRAIGPDNDPLLLQLIDLFTSTYADSFPVQGVYDLQFWKSHIGQRFISLVVLHDGEIVGHLAFFGTPQFPKCLQACLPACHPGYIDAIGAIGEALAKTVTALQQRQNWRQIYFFVLNDIPFFHQLSRTVLGAMETAICPEYFAPTGFQVNSAASGSSSTHRGRTHVAVTQRIYPVEEPDARVLFVPAYHQDICQQLIASLGLNRILAEGGNTEKVIPIGRRNPLSLSAIVSSDQPAVQRMRFQQTGVVHALIQPSLVRSAARTLDQIEQSDSACRLVLVNMEDAACPEFCDTVEQRGYRFCGIFPLLQGADHLMYSNMVSRDLDSEVFCTARSRELAKYISSYTLCQNSNRLQVSEAFDFMHPKAEAGLPAPGGSSIHEGEELKRDGTFHN